MSSNRPITDEMLDCHNHWLTNQRDKLERHQFERMNRIIGQLIFLTGWCDGQKIKIEALEEKPATAAPRWTTRVPIEEGVYWYRIRGKVSPTIAHVFALAGGNLHVAWMGTEETARVELHAGNTIAEWAGPMHIPSPMEWPHARDEESPDITA